MSYYYVVLAIKAKEMKQAIKTMYKPVMEF